jgi:hypothetical protein
MEPVIESDLDQSSICLGRAGYSIDVRDANARRLLDKDVGPAIQSGTCRRSEVSVNRGDDHDVWLFGQQIFEAHAGFSAMVMGE